MIRKPTSTPAPQTDPTEVVRDIARHGVTVARMGGQYVSGVILWGFALLWGYVALQVNTMGDNQPMFLLIGAMAIAAGFFGTLKFATARRYQSQFAITAGDAKAASSPSTKRGGWASEDRQTDSGKTGAFDPDAIVARYLAEKARQPADDNFVQSSQTRAVPTQRQFGRKGI